MSEEKNNTGFGDRAREMLMLDMLDGMHEFFTQAAYRSSLTNSFEIVSDEGNQEAPISNPDNGAKVISFNEARARRAFEQRRCGEDLVDSRSLIKS